MEKRVLGFRFATYSCLIAEQVRERPWLIDGFDNPNNWRPLELSGFFIAFDTMSQSFNLLLKGVNQGSSSKHT